MDGVAGARSAASGTQSVDAKQRKATATAIAAATATATAAEATTAIVAETATAIVAATATAPAAEIATETVVEVEAEAWRETALDVNDYFTLVGVGYCKR